MRLLAKMILWLMQVAIPIVIAACYGAPFRYSKSGKVIDSETRAGINGIRITCLENGNDWNTSYSFSDGHFDVFYDVPCEYLRFTDEDGPENGGHYAERLVPFDEDCPEITVELDHKVLP